MRETAVSVSNGSGRVELRGVSKRFDSSAGSRTAVSELDLVVEPSEFVSLLGPSGCGKTSLLRMIGGLLEPTTGSIVVDGETVTTARQQRKFGFVFQDATLLPWRTVRANAALLLEVIGGREPARRVETLLETVGLSEFADHYPAQLSGGMRQRVALARALAIDPQILLMDEPFAALDAITRDRLGAELLRIWDGARSVVFVTHAISEAVLLSDRVIVMSARPGRVIADVRIELPRPRDASARSSEPFSEYERQLRTLVEEAHA